MNFRHGCEWIVGHRGAVAYADNVSAKINEGVRVGAEIFGGPLDRAIADIGAYELFHEITGKGNAPF